MIIESYDLIMIIESYAWQITKDNAEYESFYKSVVK